MKKILFLIPINRTYVIMPPLGLGYLSTIARAEGFEPKILDCLKEKMTYEAFEDHILKNPADIFGISMMTYDFNSVKRHIGIIRKHYPKSIIILGGAHPSGDYENILLDYPEADFAFRGESEKGFAKLLRLLEKKSKDVDYSPVDNLIWRKKGKIVFNPWSVIEDLDTIAFPAWDLMDPRTYPEAPHGAFANDFPVAPIVITRGCPFQCTFCSGKTTTGNVIRKRSIKNVMDEIRHLIANYGVREIHIEDENFTLHKKLVMEFCNELMRNRFNVSWACPAGVRLDTLDAEMLNLMQRSGCHSLAVGVEFGSQRIHELTKKRLSLDIIKNKIELLGRYDIKITGFFLMGIPGETKKEMIDTIKFAKKLRIHRAQFNNFMPLPGSEIYRELKRTGELKIDTDRFFVHDVGYVPKGMTMKEMKNLQRRAYLEFYLRPGIIFGLIREVKDFRQFMKLIQRFRDGLK
jgi:anaerobic magnesium-protoporphyrin IX monomethyl ester cyclase